MVKNLDSRKNASAGALGLFRRAAGFRSATAAAQHFGWPASRYRSHESGVRPVKNDDAVRYAAGFGVSLNEILSPTGRMLDEVSSLVSSQESDRRHGRAARLRALRLLAGYDSAAEFCRDWDLVAGSYIKHESGQNVLGEPTIQLYAAIHDVHASWLSSDTLPSGMGSELDARIHDVVQDPTVFRNRRVRSPPDREEIARLKLLLDVGRRPVPSLGLLECDWEDLERAEGRAEEVSWNRGWSAPTNFFPSSSLHQGEIFVVAVTHTRDEMTAGERIFVHRGGFAGSDEGFLCFAQGRMCIIRATATGTVVIGAVIGRLRSPVLKSRPA